MDLTRWVNSRLEKENCHKKVALEIGNNNTQTESDTYCIPLQFVQMKVQKFVHTYCGPCQDVHMNFIKCNLTRNLTKVIAWS